MLTGSSTVLLAAVLLAAALLAAVLLAAALLAAVLLAAALLAAALLAAKTPKDISVSSEYYNIIITAFSNTLIVTVAPWRLLE